MEEEPICELRAGEYLVHMPDDAENDCHHDRIFNMMLERDKK